MTPPAWTLLDAHQMGARLHMGIPDKKGGGFHDKNPRNIVACRTHPDGAVESAVWGDDGELIGVRELVALGEAALIQVLDAGESTKVERTLRIGRKVGGAGLRAVT